MINPLSWITGGVIEGVGKVATDVGRTFWGDKTEKEQHVSAEQLAVLNQYAAEYVARQQRTWWDSFIDGLNRLVRPGLALGAQGAFVWVWWDPVSFAECMRAMQLVPEMLWYIWLTIFGFFFGGRIIENAPKTWRVEPRALEVAKEIAAERTARQDTKKAEKQAEAAERQAAAVEKTVAAQKDALASATAAKIELDTEPKPADNSRDPIRAVAATLWGEARNESRDGKIGVAWVIRNRVEQPCWWGEDWQGVCLARRQFSCWWDKQGPKVRAVTDQDPKFRECLEIALGVINGEIPDPTSGADHYYAPIGMRNQQPPKWAIGKEPTVIIGGHRFYKLGNG